MSKEVSIADAKRQLSAWVRHAEHGEAIIITRRGKPVAALVGADALEQLDAHQRTTGRDLPELE